MDSPRTETDYVPLETAAEPWDICIFFPHMKDAYWLGVEYGVTEEAKQPGVRMRGGVGRLESVFLGALFIGLVENGKNPARIESYLRTVVLGALLIPAVITDQIRQRYVATLKD